MAREERKARITKQREKQILNAALDVFSEKGFGAATIPDIAEKAGLAVGSIYNYFPNKRELFVAVIRDFILNAPLMELIEGIPDHDLSEIFAQIIENRLDLIDDISISRIPFLMSEIQRDPELKELWYREFLQPFFGKMEGIYTELNTSKRYEEAEPEITVRILGGAILGFLMLRIMEGDYSPLNRIPKEKVTEHMMRFLLFGVLGENGLMKRRNDEQ